MVASGGMPGCRPWSALIDSAGVPATGYELETLVADIVAFLDARELPRVHLVGRAVAKKLPPDVLAFFRQQGAKGGRIGGRRVLETMSPEARVARAKKASAAAVAARKRVAKKAK